MTCLSERIVGAIFSLLIGYALAGCLPTDSAEPMTVANIAPMPVNMAPPIAEPQAYLNRYGMEYQPAASGKPFYAPVESFYGPQLPHDFRFGAEAATLTPGTAPRHASDYLQMGPSTAPQLSFAQLPNTTLTLGAQPQRRLSLTVEDWVFSATARIAVLHSHDTGATLSVRHGF